MPSGQTRELVDQLVATQALHLKEEYGHLEKDLAVSIADHPHKASNIMATESQTKLLSLLCMLPHGVIKWSHAVPGKSLPLECLACVTCAYKSLGISVHAVYTVSW